ncbi:MAG: sigma factor, partial [Planctomycetota bacterium]
LAIQKLIIAHHGRLRKFAVKAMSRELRAKLEPDDLLQQVYVDVLKHIADYRARGPDSFFHWLVRIFESKIVDAQPPLPSPRRS